MDLKYIGRIIDVFTLSETLFKNSRDLGFMSLHWEEMNHHKVLTTESLVNFRSNKQKKGGISLGLDDNFNSWSGTLESWRSLIPEDYMIDRLPSIDVGNAGLTKYRAKYLDFNKLHHIYWLYLVKSSLTLTDDPSKIVCEIGGGYGSFVDLLLGKHRKALLIDLPLSNALSAYYLASLFPNKKLLLFDDYLTNKRKISYKDFEEHDIIILPPGCDYDRDLKIDLIVNARSFMEMTTQSIAYHFRFIQQHLKEGGLFLNINRYQKITSGEVINFHNYPYDSRWQVLKSIPLETQPHIHLLLTRRTSEYEEGNIRQALKLSKKIGSRYRVRIVKLIPQLLKIRLYKLKKYLLKK